MLHLLLRHQVRELYGFFHSAHDRRTLYKLWTFFNYHYRQHFDRSIQRPWSRYGHSHGKHSHDPHSRKLNLCHRSQLLDPIAGNLLRLQRH